MCQRLVIFAVLLISNWLSVADAQTVVSGFLRQSDGTPIYNQRVSVDQNWSSSRSTNSAVDGSFQFLLTPGNWKLRVRWETWIDYPFVVGSDPIQINVTNPPISAQAEGFIQTEFGQALTNIQIDFHATNGGFHLWSTARSDSNGFFNAKLPNGTWFVQANSYDIAQLRFQPIPPRQIDLLNDTNSTLMIVAYEPTNIITGRVVDETGAAITNLTVHAQYETFRKEAVTDENGHYSMTVPSGWWYVELHGLTERNLIAPAPFPPIEATNAVTIHNLAVYRANYTMRISFEDEAGQPFHFENPGGAYYVSAYTSLLGKQIQVSQRFENSEATLKVAPGVWWLNFNLPPEYKRPYKNIQIFDESVEVKFRLEKVQTNLANATVSGQVVDESGQPITNATVTVYSQAAATSTPLTVDQDGRFQLTVAAGYTSLSVSGGGDRLYPSVYFDLEPAQSMHRIIRGRSLTSAIKVSVKFVNGLTPRLASIDAWSQSGGYSYSTSASSTNEGELTLRVFPGKWTVYGFSFSAQTGPAQTVLVTDQHSESVVFEFRPITNFPLHVQGQLIEPGGAPVENALVRIHSPLVSDNILTGPTGGFDLTGPFGFVEIIFLRLSPIVAYFVPDPAGPHEINLGNVELPLATIMGQFKFVDENGTEIPPPPDHHLSILRETNGITYQSMVYELNGQLKGYVSPGEWTVSSQAPKGYAFPRPVKFNATPNFLQPIPLRKLAIAATPPTISFVRGTAGQPMVRAGSDSALFVYIETSTDLKTWSYAAQSTLSDPYADFEVPDLTPETNSPIFFRAITTP